MWRMYTSNIFIFIYNCIGFGYSITNRYIFKKRILNFIFYTVKRKPGEKWNIFIIFTHI
ncbi:hypothetical protein Hanom_Chr10g00889331 [Helianthus anomalus]